MTFHPRFTSPIARLAPLALLAFGACGPMTDVEASLEQGLVSAPSLGAASSFAVLGASTVTCTGPSAITGDVGVSPGTGLAGFNPPCTLTGTLHAGDALAARAHADLGTAYGALAAAVCQTNLSGQDLGGMTLAPGVYCFNTSAGVTGKLTLDAGGDANAVWIFQMGSTLTTGTNSSIVMAGHGQAGNVFYKVGSSATIGTGTAFKGNLLAYASVTLVGGANVIGRAMALNAAVTMDNNKVTLANGSSSTTPPTPGVSHHHRRSER